MFALKDFSRQLLKILIYFLLLSIFTTIFYHFNIIGDKVCSYLRLIGFIIIIYFNSNNLSRKINANQLLHGLLLGSSIIFIFLIIAIIMHYKINLKLIIYYLIILLVSILGSSRKKKKSNSKK